MVAGEAQFTAILQQAGKAVQVGFGHHAAAMVTGFRPGVGKQHEYTANACVRQGVHQDARVIIVNTHIFQTRLIDMGKQAGDTVDKWLTADKADLRMVGGLGRQVLACTEADFQPDIRAGRTEPRTQSVLSLQAFRVDSKLRQQAVNQSLATEAQLFAVPSAIPARVGIFRCADQDAPKADFRSAAMSVRSQEKPPSSSGMRPKWP